METLKCTIPFSVTHVRVTCRICTIIRYKNEQKYETKQRKQRKRINENMVLTQQSIIYIIY